ncbi:MAG: hypothetical protein 5 [Bactrocera oleae negev-like virus]|nr:MAG: hypothetical protein 5 [Bactrocera oleae negev-like virus]
MSEKVISVTTSESVVTNGNSLVMGILNSYTKLTEHPFAMFVLILSILSIIAETNSQNGPFEIIRDTLIDYIAKHKDTNPFPTTLASFVLGIIKFIITFKDYIFYIMLVSMISIVYPQANIILLILLGIYVIVSTHSPIVKILIIECVFVYFNLYSTMDRLIIITLFLFLVFDHDTLLGFFKQDSATLSDKDV